MTEQIRKIINNERISIRAFEKKISASNGLIRKALQNNTDIQSKWASAIVDNFPQYNPDWLLTGKGEMLKTGEKSVNQSIIGDNNQMAGNKIFNRLENEVDVLKKQIIEKDLIIKELLEQNKKLINKLTL